MMAIAGGVWPSLACIADETAARDALKKNWSKYSATDKQQCLGMEKTGGPASYVELQSCLEIRRDARDIRIPDGYRDRVGRLPTIEAALAVHPLPTVPCHNDLLAENYLDDGQRLWIVDYEYSGNNDPTFELGNTCQELGWDDDRIRELCAAYFGEATDALLARMRLQMIMSDVGWTLWAAIQAAISTIDYDFWGWSEERWGRASAALAGPDLDDWLTTVRA